MKWLTTFDTFASDFAPWGTSIPESDSSREVEMSVSLVMRAVLAATALSVAPAIAGAQAPQTKPCKDGTSSSRSTFACWGHGGVETGRAAERERVPVAKHQAAEPVQAGTPRAKHAKSTAHKESKATVHHAKPQRPESRAAKKPDHGHRGWLPWRHKKAKEDAAKKKKKHNGASRPPITERPRR